MIMMMVVRSNFSDLHQGRRPVEHVRVNTIHMNELREAVEDAQVVGSDARLTPA